LAVVIGMVWGAAVSAKPALHPDARRVRIVTEPPGCQITVVPLDDQTRDPIPGQIRTASRRSPAEMDLMPGDYLIVAVKDADTFHEVLRHVPLRGDVIPHHYPHQSWTVSDGVVELPAIPVRAPSARIQLVPVPDGHDFLVTNELAPPDFSQRLSVPGFFAARDPIDREDLLRFHRLEATSPEIRKMPVNFNTAVMLAERNGLRLPSAAECALMADLQTQLEAQGISGLDDEQGEWTSSRPGAIGCGLTQPPAVGQSHAVIMGLAGQDDHNSLGEPVQRLAMEYRLAVKAQPEIGVRLVRSAKPRISADDFPVARPEIVRGSARTSR